MKRCLYCYQLLSGGEHEFHPICSRRIFNQAVPPVMPYTDKKLEELAIDSIRSQIAVTGVQPKISLQISKVDKNTNEKRFTIVGLWGGYILKPQTNLYPELPEFEDLTMSLAEIAGIRTAVHSLIRLNSGNLAYITKRMDRVKTGKLAMEDFCQLTERLTENKYKGSYEQIGKAILKYSNTSVLDLVNFFEIVIFSFLTGNSDMHLKNFSLIEQPGLGYVLAPAYDLLNTTLVNPADNEELALALNGKKRKIKRRDFLEAMNSLGIHEKQQLNIFRKMENALPAWFERIEISFLSADFKMRYKELIEARWKQLSL